ncbi:MAG: hypothetical protein AAF399_00750 [Bacteroidota bacterium]
MMAGAFFSSCGLENPQVSPVSELEVKQDKIPASPALEDGMLIVKDENHLVDLMRHTESMGLEELEAYVQALGHESMGLEFQKFLDFSERSSEKGYGMSIEELRNEYGDIVQIEDDGMFDLNCYSTALANLLNREGVIKVAEDVYKVSLNKVVQIKGGDVDKLAYFPRLQESVPEEGIFVYVFDYPNEASRDLCRSLNYCSSGTFGAPCTQTGVASRDWCFPVPPSSGPCEYRLRVNVNNIQNSAAEQLNARIRTYERGAFGIWYSYNAKVEVRGDATVNGTNGASTTRSSMYIDSWGTDRTVLLLNNSPMAPVTSPKPPDLPAPAYYDEACVDLSFEMYVDGNTWTYDIN